MRVPLGKKTPWANAGTGEGVHVLWEEGGPPARELVWGLSLFPSVLVLLQQRTEGQRDSREAERKFYVNSL